MSSFQSRFLVYTAGLLLAAAQAGAVGTDAGTDISNSASVDYDVSGVDQPDVTSNTVTFETDRVINLTVAEVGGAYTDVAPGQVEQVLTFTVSNTSNAPLDFRLDVAQDSTGTTEAHGGTDDFDVTPAVFVDSTSGGTAGVYDVGIDTETFLDEIAEDDTVTVFIVSAIPLGQANGNTSGLTLTAVAAEPGTAATLGADAAETGVEAAAVIDTVFGDAAGDTDAAKMRCFRAHSSTVRFGRFTSR